METNTKSSRIVRIVKLFTVLAVFTGATAYVAIASKPENDQSHAFKVLLDGGESGSWSPTAQG